MLIDRDWTAKQLMQNLQRVLSPAVCLRVIETLRDPSRDFEDVAQALRGDPYLSAKVVAMANLTQGDCKPPILSINRAVQVLGMTQTRVLVMGVLLTAAMFEGSGPQNRDLRRWVLALGVAGDFIGQHREGDCAAMRGEGAQSHHHLVGGLLKGLGPLVLHAGLGAEYDRILGSPPRVLELRHWESMLLGATHDQVTIWALQSMRCPVQMAHCVETPDAVEPLCKLCGRAVELLAAVIAGLEPGRAEAWLADGLPRIGVDLPELMDRDVPELRKKLADLAKVFNVDVGEAVESLDRASLIAESGRAMQSLLADKLSLDTSLSMGLHREAVTAIAQEAAQRGADEDPLTGVLNRRGLMRRLRELERETAGLAGLLLLDLDEFKQINDTHGHARGDEALRRVAAVLGSCTPTPLAIGRIGGDEFVCVSPLQDAAALASLAQRIRDELLGGEAPVRVSIGGALLELAVVARNWDRCFRMVDERLYRAKQAGRDRAVLEE